MHIHVENIAKKFSNQHYIFKNLNFDLFKNQVYGVSGANGAGKTTLLSLLAGNQVPSKGKIEYLLTPEKAVPNHLWFQYLTYAAPYADLYEYLTVLEMTQFFKQIKGFANQISVDDVIETAMLSEKSTEFTKNLSSGMKQRLKLALTILSNSDVLLLDEPTTNLDLKTQDWFKKLLEKWKANRIIVIASNDPNDFELTDSIISLN